MIASLDQYPCRDGLFRILPDGVAVHNRYQDRIVMLDGLSSELWLRANGNATLRQIAYELAGWRGESADKLMHTIAILVVVLNSEGVMYQTGEPQALPYHLSLPQEDQDEERMHESLVAAGWIDE